MSNFYAQVFLLLFLAGIAGRASAQAPFTNPVIKKPAQNAEIPDPYVLKWNGEYYLYTSGDPITAYHSTDLVNWEFIGPALASSKEPDAWNQVDIWAPEVVYRNGKFYMYYTGSRRSDDWRVTEVARRIGVAVSDSPRGPFKDIGEPITAGWGIDGSVFKDPDTGEEFLFYSYLYEPRLPGAGIVTDHLTSWKTLSGKPSHVVRGSEPWEDKDGDPNNGSLRYTNEGPTVLKKFGRYYVMYSGGSWDLPTYSLAYATSDKVMQDGLDGPGWKKVMPPVLRGTPLVDAPGHNAATIAPNNFDLINVFHARTVPFLDPWNRMPFVDRIFWNHERMSLPSPSTAEAPPPDRPMFHDLFNRADGAIGPQWKAEGGTWRVAGGALQQTARAGTAVLVPKVAALISAIIEANVKLTSGNGSAGVSLTSEGNQLSIWIDSARRSLVSFDSRAANQSPEQATALPADFDFTAFHQLLVTRNGRSLRVMLDGVHAQSRRLPGAFGAFGVALVTRDATAEFDAVAITAAFEDLFDSPVEADGWSTQSGLWLVDEGALNQGAGGDARHVAVKGDPADSYEFIASVRWRDHRGKDAQAGVVAAAAGPEMVLAGFDYDIWPFARFVVRHVSGGQVKRTIAAGLPRGFNYGVFHTVRVVKQGSGFTFFLDGKETISARFPINQAQPGLFTEGARASFDVVSMKHLIVPQNLLLNGSFETEQWGEGNKASNDNPWTTTGGARSNYCCAHTGLMRIIVTEADGSAKQNIEGLKPGKYRLVAYVISRGAAKASISVSGLGGATVSAPATSDNWKRVVLEFVAPTRSSSVTVSFDAGIRAGSGDFAAADDFYLYRQ